jgi:hypothetical protein
VSFFGLFCHYHAKALSGGQINMEVGTTDFGRYGLIADGKSTTPIFTATSNGSATAAAVTFAINAPTTGSGWFGDANRPAINMLAEVTVSGTTYLYPILNSGINGAGWNVTISRPNPSNRSQNLGLDVTVPSGTQWRFYLRSMVSTASHTMEYAGSGTDYTALPENGGVAQEANEAVNRNGGKVWLTSTDQSGRFKVGDTFAVDQQTGFITIDPAGIAANVVSDTSPELGGDLDVLARRIYSSVGNVVIAGRVVLTNSDGIQLAAKVSDLFSSNGSLSYYATNNGVYLNGAGPDGYLKLNAAGTENNRTSLYLYGSTSAAPDSIIFRTANNERLRIDASGRLLLGTSTANTSGAKLQTSDGITFPATAVASADPNTLDDYEEGTFTVTLTPSTSGSITLSASYQTLYYCKIGQLVTIGGLIIASSASSPLGYVSLNLPFAVSNTINNNSSGSIAVDGATGANATQFTFLAQGGGATARIYLGNTASLTANSAQAIGSTGQVYLALTYKTT